MANEKHLAILERGVRIWNAWRLRNREITPDLQGANLRKGDLVGADFQEARLQNADFREADLSEAILQKAELTYASLYGATLNNVDCGGTNFTHAYLRYAIMKRSNLQKAVLDKVYLSDADLRGANLTEACITWADLQKANLACATIERTRFWETDLRGANLSHCLGSSAILAAVDLREARMEGIHLRGAELSNSKLWGTRRDGWSIRGVICERAYWDREGKVPTEYGPNEFERVYAERPRVVLKYADGLRPIELVMLPLVIERLQAEHPGCKLHLRSILDEGRGATVTITVDDTADRPPDVFRAEVEELRTQATTFRALLLQSEAVRHRLEGQLATFQSHIMPLFRELVMAPKYTITGPAGNVGDGISAGKVTVTNNDLEVIGKLITQVQDNAAEIVARAGKEQLNELQRLLVQLRVLAASRGFDRALVTETKRTIRNIVEGSIGSVLGSGWLTALQGLF